MTAGQIKAPSCIPLRSSPGTKQHIDDETPLELSCETPNTAIFYSLNGEKPLPFNAKSKHTYLYQGPFLLRAGKHIIKSVAAFSDGRQSNIVSKVYRVASTLPIEDLETVSLKSELTVGPDPVMKQFEEDYKRRVLGESIENNIHRPISPLSPNLYTAQRARTPTPSKLAGNQTPIIKRRSVKIASECMKQVRPNHVHSKKEEEKTEEERKEEERKEEERADLTFTKESDKCPQCFTDKPPNPLSKHCHRCGYYLPPHNDDGAVKCLHCHSLIPGGVAHCLICNAPVTSPQIQLHNQDQVVCGECNFVNPGGSATCLVCESRLKVTVRPATPTPSTAERMCTKCSRCLSVSSRYCDWCGSSLVDISTTMTCVGCNFQNPPLALYCGNCGNTLLPKKSKVCWADQITESPSKREDERKSVEKVPIQLITASSQTEGIFYKSAKRLQTEEDFTTDKIRNVYTSRGTTLSAYSPGKGNWRQNTEHLCNHIKVYTQLNTEFQPIVGKEQLGKVTMATVFKDADEVNLSFVFSLKKNSMIPSPSKRGTHVTQSQKDDTLRKLNLSKEENHTDMGDIKQTTPSPVVEAERCMEEDRSVKEAGELTGDGVVKDSDEVVEKPVKDNEFTPEEMVRNTPARRSIKKRVPKDMHELRVGKLNTQLLQEVVGEGDETRVKRVLSQGAKACITNSSGVSALCLAVKNKHLGAIIALVEGGADVGYQVGHSGDTALHIAVQSGAHSSIKYLTESGAKFDVPNNLNKTALDLARERHNQRAVQLFTGSLGAGLLATLVKH